MEEQSAVLTTALRQNQTTAAPLYQCLYGLCVCLCFMRGTTPRVDQMVVCGVPV